MNKNIISIDIDTEREDQIRISKPKEFYDEGNSQELLERDIKDLAFTALYLSSMLSHESELTALNNIEQLVKQRKNEITGDH